MSNFIDKMAIYFNTELDLSEVNPYELEYFKSALESSYKSDKIRIIDVNRGMFGTLFSKPYMILAFTQEGYNIYLSEFYDELRKLDDTYIGIIESLSYGIMVRYDKTYKYRRSKNKETREWLNKVYKLINKYYGTNILMLRTW